MPMGEHAGLAGPAIVFVLIALLGLLARLIVGAGRAAPDEGDDEGNDECDDDFGLLRVAALTDDTASADVIRALLATAGIRATAAPALDGRVRVLVFADDLDHARAVVSGPAA